jgi:hypothetical protein
VNLSGFPRSPRFLKGALVSFATINPIPQVVLFQYNPNAMTRSLSSQIAGSAGGGGGGQEVSPIEAFRLKGPPVETIGLEIELDATDRLEHPKENDSTVIDGIYHELSALELLMYPRSQDMITINEAAAAGVLEVIPPEGPFTLFVWGRKRVVPVHLNKFEIVEEAYDTNLNPIRAKISLELRVLTYLDLRPDHPGYSLYFAHQVSKETMAKTGVTSDLTPTGNNTGSLFNGL